MSVTYGAVGVTYDCPPWGCHGTWCGAPGPCRLHLLFLVPSFGAFYSLKEDKQAGEKLRQNESRHSNGLQFGLEPRPLHNHKSNMMSVIIFVILTVWQLDMLSLLFLKMKLFLHKAVETVQQSPVVCSCGWHIGWQTQYSDILNIHNIRPSYIIHRYIL